MPIWRRPIRRKLPAMALFRRKPDRIRGVAGSLDGRTVVVADGCRVAGPGIVRVVAEAGAETMMIGPDQVSVDLARRPLEHTAGSVTGLVASTVTEAQRSNLLATIGSDLAALILNPVPLALPPDTTEDSVAVDPVSAVKLARQTVDSMRDHGRIGSIVFIATIDHPGPAAAASAYLLAEMKQLAGTAAANGIRVNAVSVGQVAVNRRGNVVASRVAPLGHASVHPVEVGKAVWFLINDDLSPGITGSVLTVDRGTSLLQPDW